MFIYKELSLEGYVYVLNTLENVNERKYLRLYYKSF